MKTICIYHKIDLDGWMSAAIVKKWFKESNKDMNIVQFVDIDKGQKLLPSEEINSLSMLGWNYGDKIPDLSNYDKVIMCDISFSKEEMQEIHEDKIPGNFIWIDHHKSAMLECNNLVFVGLRNTKFAACELTWQYFFPEETVHYQEMPEIVRLLGRYDCFGHKGTEEEQKVLEFQYGARACMNDYEDCFRVLSKSVGDLEWDDVMTPEGRIQRSGESIYQYLCTEAKQIYKRAFEIEFMEPSYITVQGEKKGEIVKTEIMKWKRKFLCVNQERFNPINFDIDYHKDGYDGFASFWLREDGLWEFKLMNDNGEVDCSAIAKQYGGGGHRGASGFICDYDTLKEFINK